MDFLFTLFKRENGKEKLRKRAERGERCAEGARLKKIHPNLFLSS